MAWHKQRRRVPCAGTCGGADGGGPPGAVGELAVGDGCLWIYSSQHIPRMHEERPGTLNYRDRVDTSQVAGVIVGNRLGDLSQIAFGRQGLGAQGWVNQCAEQFR